jgi:hypothetical protein
VKVFHAQYGNQIDEVIGLFASWVAAGGVWVRASYASLFEIGAHPYPTHCGERSRPLAFNSRTQVYRSVKNFGSRTLQAADIQQPDPICSRTKNQSQVMWVKAGGRFQKAKRMRPPALTHMAHPKLTYSMG